MIPFSLLVLPAGFEPSIADLKGRLPGQLEDGSATMVNLLRATVLPKRILKTTAVCGFSNLPVICGQFELFEIMVGISPPNCTSRYELYLYPGDIVL